jgi:hypothetical protein
VSSRGVGEGAREALQLLHMVFDVVAAPERL